MVLDTGFIKQKLEYVMNTQAGLLMRAEIRGSVLA